MQRTLSHIVQTIKLNGERVTRAYTAEICTEINQGKQTIYNATGLEFDVTYYGRNTEGFLQYRIEVSKRFLLTKKYRVIKKLNKAQQIALRVAAINDVLEMQVSKNFKLIKITNTSEIRKKWQDIKHDLLEDFPDLDKMVDDFDWQLREENIQRLFLEDNFYSFFFSDLFYHEYEGKKPLSAKKTIANALGNINIPMIEQKKISKQNISFTDVTITTQAEIDTEHPQFSLPKLNMFLGQLPTKEGSQHQLHVDYKGLYKITPQRGLVTQGKLKYAFEVKDLYKKETTITFNLEDNE
ncbi:hypothetical protein [Aquimarina sediminis]|uniref:hypothetical protein n=1 Tax=Aquimarina sediminis TaxID=2070536 RepID=UPI000CA08171|nr:hypothetical protein [Aquimarina sediminis]